jgi:hypothetical protein
MNSLELNVEKMYTQINVGEDSGEWNGGDELMKLLVIKCLNS